MNAQGSSARYILESRWGTIELSMSIWEHTAAKPRILDHTLFKIERKLGKVIFRLELLEDIRIYSIFYISLLELALKNSRI